MFETRTQEDGTVKTRFVSVMLLLALVLTASIAAAMDAPELIAKATEAMGGAKLKAIQSQKATGKFVAQGMEIPFTMVTARPGRLRVDAAVMGMSIIQCFDKTSGWSINPMTGSKDPVPMGDLEVKGMKLQSDMDGPFVNWEAKGFAVEYLGQEDVEGTSCYGLRLDTKQDIVMDYWFDADSFLVVKQNTKIKVDQSEMETQNYPSDYRQQDGVTIPFALQTRKGDQVLNQMVVEKVEFGVAVDDAMFAMPAPAAAAETTGK